MNYKTIETDQRVEGTKPELITRFYWRAERRCRKLNAKRTMDFYRYEIHPLNLYYKWWRLDKKKWEVVAMQNKAVPI